MNFKKHISIFLAFFLLVSHVGLAFDVHYCGDEIASVKPVLWKKNENSNKEKDSCCTPKPDKKDSCCKDKKVNFQKKSENTIINSVVFQPHFFFLVTEWEPVFFMIVSSFEKTELTTYYCDANAPPLFQLYHQYIFYA